MIRAHHSDSICTLRYYVARRNDLPIQENIFEDAVDEICVKSTIDSSQFSIHDVQDAMCSLYPNPGTNSSHGSRTPATFPGHPSVTPLEIT